MRGDDGEHRTNERALYPFDKAFQCCYHVAPVSYKSQKSTVETIECFSHRSKNIHLRLQFGNP